MAPKENALAVRDAFNRQPIIDDSSTSAYVLRSMIWSLRQICLLVRDFGIPIVTFGAGLYFLAIYVFGSDVLDIQYKALIATALVIVGLMAQLWLYQRELPAQKQLHEALIDRLFGLIEPGVRGSAVDGKPQPPPPAVHREN